MIILMQLYDQLMSQTSFLVGQSGVGKSTITNMLLNNQELKTKALSSKTNKGRHTTSTTSLYQINPKSYLIDTPGVENLHPAIENYSRYSTWLQRDNNAFRKTVSIEIVFIYLNHPAL